MAENPRELIRAAQTAELQGDVPRAVECLQRAAEAYRKAGNAPRALQLLRHARRLDGSRLDIIEEVQRLEWMPETLLSRGGGEEDEDSRLVQALTDDDVPLPELARRQRLIDEALRAVEARGEKAQPPRVHETWVLETEVAEDLQRLEAQLARVAALAEVSSDADIRQEEVGRRQPGGEAGDAVPAASARPRAPSSMVGVEDAGLRRSGSTTAGAMSDASAGPRAPSSMAGGAWAEREARAAAPEDDVEPGAPAEGVTSVGWGVRGVGLIAEEGMFLAEDGMNAPPVRSTWRPDPRDEEPAPRRRRAPRIIERGPTRADVAADAWCSFCCRPQAEVGALVAGPAGAFICKACLTESASLLGDVTPVPRPTHPGSTAASAADVAFVGQPEVMASLERSLHAGARCLLVVGPEGCGKSTLFSQWQRRGWGVRAPVASLAEAVSTTPLFVEDVDRLSPEDHAALCAFLERDVRPAVVLGARGQVREHGGVRLRGDAGPCLLPTTEALSHAVQGRIPTGVLERVQVLVPLAAPSVADSMEIARARLASRDPAVSLSEDALAAVVKEAARSPRSGHELRALLDRIPAGTWGLEPEAKQPAAPRKGRRKGTS